MITNFRIGDKHYEQHRGETTNAFFERVKKESKVHPLFWRLFIKNYNELNKKVK